MLIINTLSIFINLSDKEIAVYLPVGTINFYLHKNLQTGTCTHTPSYAKRQGREK
jgi:hypothetical protein